MIKDDVGLFDEEESGLGLLMDFIVDEDLNMVSDNGDILEISDE